MRPTIDTVVDRLKFGEPSTDRGRIFAYRNCQPYNPASASAHEHPSAAATDAELETMLMNATAMLAELQPTTALETLFACK